MMKGGLTWRPNGKTYHLEISYANQFILSGGSPGRIERITEYLDKVDGVIDGKITESDRKLITVHGLYKGLPVTAFSTGMGPASVAITLPEVIEACDDPNMVIIRLGTSGARQPHLSVGDFAVSTYIESKENTSEKIMGKGYIAMADDDVIAALFEEAERHQVKERTVWGGHTEVVNELYLNVLEGKEPSSTGAIAVSMEFSVYCAWRDLYNKVGINPDYSDYTKERVRAMPRRNIKVGNLLQISDNPLIDVDMTEFLKIKEKVEDAHIRAGLETLLRMSKS